MTSVGVIQQDSALVQPSPTSIPPGVPAPVGAARMIVESSLRRLVLVALLPWILAVSSAGLSPDASWPPRTVVAAAAVGLVGYAVFALTGRRAPLVGLLIATCLGLGVTCPSELSLVGSPLIASWLNLTSFTVGALVVWRVALPLGIANVLGTLGLAAAGLTAAGRAYLPGEMAAIALYALNDLAVVALAATILRRTAREGDAAARARADAAALTARAESSQAELRRVFRLIHDTAINTLGAVARLSSLDRVMVAQRCAADLEALSALDRRPPDGPASVLSSVRRRAQLLGVALDLDAPVPGPTLGPGVGEALEGAAWEALNNIAKHSGQRRAAVDWQWDGARGRLAVMDSGRGFDAGIDMAQGLDESIVHRCAQVGISSRVISAPGAGTAVVLTWSGGTEDQIPGGAATAGDSTLEAILAESVRGIAAVFAVTGIVATVALPEGPARLGSVLSLAIVVLLAVVAHLRLRGHVLLVPGWAYPVAAVIASWAPAVTLAGCSRSGSWNWGPLAGIAVAAAAIMLDRRRWVVLLTIGGYVLGNLQPIREVGPGYPVCTQEALSILVVDLAVIAGILAYRRQVSRAWLAGQRQHAAMREELASAVRAQRASETRRGLMAIALRVAEPVLSGLADGDLDPGDPDVRAEAARAERVLRSLAAIPVADPGGAGEVLTDLVLAAQERSVALTLSLNANPEQTPDTVRRAAPMLSAVLEACPAGSAAQITVLQSSSGLQGLVLINPSCAPTSADVLELAPLGRVLETAGWTVTVIGEEILAETVWENRE